MTHNLKKVANCHKVCIVFSAPKELSRLCLLISSSKECASLSSKKQASPVVQCDLGVVYEILLACGKSYVGLTNCCISDCAREQQLSIKNNEMADLPAHCAACGD